jgi:hypothetical protein
LHRHFAFIALILCALALRVHAAEPLPVAGRVEFVAGDVRFVDDARRSRTPVKGDKLLATETVVTGRSGEIHLDMEDGGYMAVRSNSSVRVKEYRARGDAEDRSVLQLLVGSLRVFTGWIPRLSPRSYRIETLTATIGVRGTDHEPYFIPLGSDVGIPGTYDRVNEGSIFIETPEGTVDVADRDRAGFAPFAKGSKPTLLDRIPEFFKGSLNEKLLDGRHQKVLDKLEEKLKLKRGGSKPEALEGGGGGGGAGGASVVPDIPLPLVPPPILPGGGGGGVPGLPSTGIGATAVEAPAVVPAAPAAPPAPPAEAPAPPPVIDKPSSSAPPAAARPRDGRALPARPRGVPETGVPAAKPLEDVTPKDRATQLQEQRLKELRDRDTRYEIDRERTLLRDQGRESDAEERALRRNRERR